MAPSPEACADHPKRGRHDAITVKPARDLLVQAAVAQNQLSGSIGEPAFPSRPGAAGAAAHNGGDGKSGATRSHAQPVVAREHGEDGEHRTFPAVSTVAHSAPVGGPGRPAPLTSVTSRNQAHTNWVRCSMRPMPALVLLPRLRPRTPFYAPAHAATPSTGVAASAAAHQGRRWGALPAGARTIRAMSATARPRTIHASVPSPSQTGRDAAGRAGPSPWACWSDAPHLPATPCAVRKEIARSSARWWLLLRP